MTEKTALLRALIEGPTDVAEERSALALLRGATTAELNEMIVGNEMHRLFGSLDNRLVGPDHRSELIQLLARDRRHELSVLSAAGVIYALQRGRTGREDEEAIRDILLATRGEELTRLKNQINARADVHDLEGLVFAGVDDRGIRQQILDHIAAEARTLSLEEAKILSDLDDTAICRLRDDRYPRAPSTRACWPSTTPWTPARTTRRSRSAT
nr:hypothetical protein [Propionibacterium sp.]